MAPVTPNFPIPIHRDLRCPNAGCTWQPDTASLTFRTNRSQADAVRNIMKHNRMTDEALVEHLERCHADKPIDNIHVTVNVSGSVVTEKDLVRLIRDEIGRMNGWGRTI